MSSLMFYNCKNSRKKTNNLKSNQIIALSEALKTASKSVKVTSSLYKKNNTAYLKMHLFISYLTCKKKKRKENECLKCCFSSPFYLLHHHFCCGCKDKLAVV